MKQKIDVLKLRELIDSPMIESQGKIYPINYPKRTLEMTNARFVIFEFLYFNGMTYDRIGKIFCRSSRTNKELDHTTVINGIKKSCDYLQMPAQNKNFIEIRNKLIPLLNDCLYYVKEGEEISYKEEKKEIPKLVFTQLETEILNCKNYLDFVRLKNKIIDAKEKIVDNRKKLVKLDLD